VRFDGLSQITAQTFSQFTLADPSSQLFRHLHTDEVLSASLVKVAKRLNDFHAAPLCA
jgi:hypothetical protein